MGNHRFEGGGTKTLNHFVLGYVSYISLQAISRLMQRNGLNHDEAEKRWKAGIDNYAVVQNADVVFATQWKHEFTQIQVSISCT